MATLTTNETLVDLYIERAIDLLRLEAGTRNKVFALLNDLEGELVAALAKVDPTGAGTVSAQQKRLAKLLTSVQSAIRASYRGASKTMTAEIREIVDQEATWTGHAINQSIGVDFVTGGLTRAGLENIVGDVFIQGAASEDWWSRQAKGLQDRFSDQMRMGVSLGESNADLIARIRGKDGAPGLMDISRSSAERLVRSSVQAAANTGREAMYAKNDDIIASLQWHATLDTRTSIWCITRDGHHYSNDDAHTPKEKGSPPWLQGPGALHWNALVEGTLITTARGAVPIESVQVGDAVLTHAGVWSTVSARRAKYLERGVIRTIHTESDWKLRATDDHPVRLANGVWKFVGALEIGDYLLCNTEGMSKIFMAESEVNSEPQNSPATVDHPQIAIQRTFELMAPDVDFEGNPQRGYREVENRALRIVLRDPTIIERDQSIAHHLFATGNVLKKVGRERLSNFLAHLVGDSASEHSSTHSFIKSGAFFGIEGASNYVRSFCWIVRDHALRLARVFFAGFLGQTPRPMSVTGWRDDTTAAAFEPDLVDLGSNGNAVPLCVGGKRAVGQIVRSFDIPKRETVTKVLSGDQIVKNGGGGGVCHEQIVALDMSIVNINVYDLEVEEHCSYVANGIVVSNCRSTSIPILKTWRDLGIDAEEIPQTTRASMDGQVPAKQTFEQWLKKQPVARQDTVLGAGKADLWRSGKIKFRDLLDQSGRPLTTEELRARAS